ncbi:MAG: uracil-DNA glycosylase [Rickettsiaceae bacterium]|nr:uracil-DNA glycosylase [Rickettsiaceae bacterium]
MTNYKLNKAWLQAMEIDDIFFEKKHDTDPSKNPPKISKDHGYNDITYFKAEAKKENFSNISLDLTVSNTRVLHKNSSRIIADNVSTLEELRQNVYKFDGCELKKGAKNTVFADGISTAEIMLIGEAPGATEDEQGIPFCGESGKLLDNMISTIGLFRQKNAYITNTIFWRPPGNRAPTWDEIDICKPFVEKHIALIKPKLLILVGGTAVSSLLGKEMQISKIRKENFLYKNQYLADSVITTAIFHPAYLLRQPSQKKTSWYDLLKIRALIDDRKIRLS